MKSVPLAEAYVKFVKDDIPNDLKNLNHSIKCCSEIQTVVHSGTASTTEKPAFFPLSAAIEPSCSKKQSVNCGALGGTLGEPEASFDG